MNQLKTILRYIREQVIFNVGYLRYLISSKNSDRAYQAMISIFCLDRGRTLALYSKLYGFLNKPYRFTEASGLFGNLDQKKLSEITKSIEENGYYTSDILVPEELCFRLEKLMESTISYPVRPDPKSPMLPPQAFHPEKLVSSRYSFMCEDLNKNSLIQDIMADRSLLAIANGYLKTAPILDSVIMAVSTDFSKTPNADAAQMYHL